MWCASRIFSLQKNYLTENEIDTLNRLVVIFLETAELRAKNRFDITMKFWHENVDRILTFNEQPLIKDKGTISKVEMEKRSGKSTSSLIRSVKNMRRSKRIKRIWRNSRCWKRKYKRANNETVGEI